MLLAPADSYVGGQHSVEIRNDNVYQRRRFCMQWCEFNHEEIKSMVLLRTQQLFK
jgi:hypothetical protein